MKTHTTRRQVLQALGAAGGSSLVMGVMDTWGLMGAAASTRPVLQGSAAGTRVIILGAGLSGLVAGYELGKAGLRLPDPGGTLLGGWPVPDGPPGRRAYRG